MRLRALGALAGRGGRAQARARPADGAGAAAGLGQEDVGQPPARGEGGGQRRRQHHRQQHEQHDVARVAHDVPLVAAVARLVQRQRAQRRLGRRGSAASENQVSWP